MTKIFKKMVISSLFLCGLLCGLDPAFSEEAPAKPAPEAVAAEKTAPAKPASEAASEKTPPSMPTDVQVTLKASLTSPLFSSYPVALVNDEPITLDDIKEAVASVHEERTEGKTKQRIDFGEILQRLINTKLIIQEAKNMGLDELPEVNEMIDAFSRQMLREQLLAEKTKDVKPDPVEVEKRYKEIAQEWKIRSVLFEKEEDAKNMLTEAADGKDFDALVDEAVKEKKAKGGEPAALMKPKDLLPPIATAAVKMKAGELSPIIKLEPKKNEVGFAVFKLLAIEYPENPEAREEAEKESAGRKRMATLRMFVQSLLKKYGKLDWKTINALDYNAKKPGIKKLLKDKRPLAAIKGEKPITIAELTETLKQKYFHGMERAIAEKKANGYKVEALLSLLEKRLIRKEALRLGIDKADGYRKAVREYRDSLLFGAFIQKAIVPDVKLRDEDVQAYYDGHKKDFSSPEMVRLRNLAFTKKEQAEEVMDKLRKGTDFNWLMSNAAGQVDKATEGLLTFEGDLLTITSLPEGIRQTVAGTKTGDVRYYGSPEGHYVLLVQQVVPPNLQPLDQVQGDIAKKLHEKKLKQSVENWANKLKESGNVKVYLMPASGI